MDINGYEAINKAFSNANHSARVVRQPNDGESPRFVEVTSSWTSDRTKGDALNALDKAGLMFPPREMGEDRTRPALKILDLTGDPIIFEDLNCER